MGRYYRHELKFICPECDLLLLERQIRFLCPLDAHVGPKGSYEIRSAYFDSLENAAYYENENGENDREKYRIRIYDHADSVIKLERKSSLSGLKHKDSCFLSREQCDALLSGGTLPEETGTNFPGQALPGQAFPGQALPGQALLADFLAACTLQLLSPKVIVDYNRTPYVHPIGNVRITFDRNIRSSSHINLFQEELPSRPILPAGMGLLEVKYDEVLPGAILDILQSGPPLQRTSFSKYYLCRKMTI